MGGVRAWAVRTSSQGSRLWRPATLCVLSTVSASILGGFDFGRRAFTAPARPLLTPAAAQNRLAAVPGRLDSHRRAASVVTFVNTMLPGAARR